MEMNHLSNFNNAIIKITNLTYLKSELSSLFLEIFSHTKNKNYNPLLLLLLLIFFIKNSRIFSAASELTAGRYPSLAGIPLPV